MLWVLLFGAALAVSILFCFLGIQAKYWTLKTLFELKFWSWFGIFLVVLILVLRLVFKLQNKHAQHMVEKERTKAEKEREQAVAQAREEGRAEALAQSESAAPPPHRKPAPLPITAKTLPPRSSRKPRRTSRLPRCKRTCQQNDRKRGQPMPTEHPAAKRVIYFDVLRVLATFAVIVLHLSAQHWADTDVFSNAWLAFNLYGGIVRWSVPIFVMISGALFLGRDTDIHTILKKNVARIATVFLSWSGCYALVGLVFRHAPLSVVLSQLITGHYHLWFLYMIVGLYLLIPLLRPIVQNETLMRYFLLLAFVFTFLLPQLALFTSFVSLEASTVIRTVIMYSYCFFPLGFTVYFVGGYYLSRRSFSRREEIVLYCVGITALLFSIIAPAVLSRAQGAPNATFYNYNDLNVLCTSVPIFVFAKQHLNFPRMGERAYALLRKLSKYSFGVYLVHPMVIELLQHFGIDTFSCNAFFSVPLLAVFVFAVSTLISALLNAIPFIKDHFV